MHPFFLLTCLSVFAVSVPVMRAAMAFSLRTGYVDSPHISRKMHEGDIPFGGGLGLICVYVIICVAGYVGAYAVPHEWLPPEIAVHAEGFRARLPMFFLAVGLCTMTGLLGFIDDLKPVREIYKLLIELCIASLFWILGFRITLHVPHQALSFAITVLWIAGITNAFNFLDNMDGLSSGVACVSCGLFALFGFQTGQLFIAGYFALLGSALLGFFAFNYPPARMFLGDCGSLFTGNLIAVGAVISTYYTPAAPNRVFPLLIPLLILSVPIFDVFSVVCIRVKSKKHILKGDRNHFSHRLLRLGMKPRAVLATVCLVSAGVGLSALYLAYLNTVECILALVQAGCIFSIIILLEQGGKHGNE